MYFCYSYCLGTISTGSRPILRIIADSALKQMGFYASLPLLAGTVGDLAGGWISDILLRKAPATSRWPALGGDGRIPARRDRDRSRDSDHDPQTCVLFSCMAFFGLEVTVGVSWAMPLDIGGDFAGSVSSVMNMCGNIGGAISPTRWHIWSEVYGWDVPFSLRQRSVCIAALPYIARSTPAGGSFGVEL